MHYVAIKTTWNNFVILFLVTGTDVCFCITPSNFYMKCDMKTLSNSNN